MTLERRTGNDFREERWQEVEFTVIYRAVFVRYFHQALQERDACQRAYTSTAMVFQDYALFPHLTVRDNVGYGLRLAKVARTEIQRRVHETLDFLGLGSLGDRWPNQLSGGQQQRVALARALIVES